MDKNFLKGCGTAMFTPFKNGEVDHEALALCTKRQVAGGVDFLVPLGTTGETPTLSAEEKLQVFQTVRSNSGGLPVVVGVGSNSLQGTIENINLLSGADAFLVVVPFYNKPPQRGIYQYFKSIASQTTKPVILYNVPSRTGANCSAETTLALARDVKNIVAVKEASGNLDQCLQILKGAPEGFSLLSGNDEDTAFLMQNGAAGVISVASNVLPKTVAGFIHSMQEGRYKEGQSLHDSLMPLFKALFVEPNPIPGKAAMAMLGLMENSLRLPLVPAEPGTEELLREVLKNYKEK